MPIIVPDINVLVSSLINRRSPPGRIRAAWRRKELDFITSEVIIARTDEVLHRPSVFTALSSASSEAQAESRIQRFLDTLRNHSRIAPHRINLRVVEKDPEDDSIVIAAVEGKADCIVSGDRHLKDLGSYESIPVLSPSEFVIRYNIK